MYQTNFLDWAFARHLPDPQCEHQLMTIHFRVGLSGGKTLSIAELAGFPESLGDEPELSSKVKLEMSLWDIPLWFILLVLFSGAEWYLRRRDNLV